MNVTSEWNVSLSTFATDRETIAVVCNFCREPRSPSRSGRAFRTDPLCKLGTYNTHDYESNGIRFDSSTQSIDSLRKDTRTFLF